MKSLLKLTAIAAIGLAIWQWGGCVVANFQTLVDERTADCGGVQ